MRMESCRSIGVKAPDDMTSYEIKNEANFLSACLLGLKVEEVNDTGVYLPLHEIIRLKTGGKARRLGADKRLMYENRLLLLRREFEMRFPDMKESDWLLTQETMKFEL